VAARTCPIRCYTVYTNAIFFRLFGSSELPSGVGIVFFILSAWVLVLFKKEIFRDDKSLYLPAAMTAGRSI
jgi:hypothetical protein